MSACLSLSSQFVVDQKTATRGGRCLEAVQLNPYLDHYEKSVLLCLGALQDFRGDFQRPRFLAVAELCLRTSIATRTMYRVLSRLEGKGYITRSTRPDDVRGGRFLPSIYRITAKVFDEDNLATSQGRHYEEEGGVCQGGSEAPRNNIPMQIREEEYISTTSVGDDILVSPERPPTMTVVDNTLTKDESVAYDVVKAIHVVPGSRGWPGADMKRTSIRIVEKGLLRHLLAYRDAVDYAEVMGRAPYRKLMVNLERVANDRRIDLTPDQPTIGLRGGRQVAPGHHRYDHLPFRDPRHGPVHRDGCPAIASFDRDQCTCGVTKLTVARDEASVIM